MTATTASRLELDDIQSGALHERPSPYVGTYLLLRIDDRADGPRAGPAAAPARRLRHGRRPIRPTTPGSPSPSPTTGSKALGVPQASLDSFAPEFRQGMAARAAQLGDVGESSPEHWEQPLGTPDVHVAVAALSPDAARLRGRRRAGPPRPRASCPGVELIWRQDCYQLPTGRTSFGFKDGIGQPAVEGSGTAAIEPAASGRSRPARSSSATPTRPASCRRCRRRRCSAATAPTSSSASCTRGWRPTGSTCAPGRRAATRRTLLGAKMVGRWQSGAPLALSPDHDDPELGADPQRNNDFLYGDDPRGFKCPVGAHARRANPRDALDQRRQRRRPPAPHDPARHQLRADAARGRARGRRRRPRHHLRLRRRAPQAPVRVRQDPVAQRRHLHRRPAREGPARRAERRLGHASPSRSGRSAAGCRTCRRSSSPAAASTASRPA